MTETESREEPEAPETDAPTAKEEEDLVALLRAGRQTKRFYLPAEDGPSDTYYIEVRTWTGAEEAEYLGTGMSWETPLGGRGGRAAGEVMRARVAPAEAFRKLVQLSVTDCLLVDFDTGRDVRFQVGNERSNWALFRKLPPAVNRWVTRTIRDFQGLDVLPESDEEDEEQGGD